MELKFLISCADEFEADLIKGALQEEGIVAMKKYRGVSPGAKYPVGVGQDVDLFVPEEQILQAKKVLQALEEEAQREGDPEDF